MLVVGTRTRATHGRIVHRQLEILFINKRIMLAWLVSWGQTANAAAHNGRSQQWTTVKEKRELGIRGVSTPVRWSSQISEMPVCGDPSRLM